MELTPKQIAAIDYIVLSLEQKKIGDALAQENDAKNALLALEDKKLEDIKTQLTSVGVDAEGVETTVIDEQALASAVLSMETAKETISTEADIKIVPLKTSLDAVNAQIVVKTEEVTVNK
jgi:hypothetical protein